MTSNNNPLFAGLQKSFKEKEKEKKGPSNILLLEKEKKYNLLPELQLELINYSEDQILNNFLAERSLKLKTIQANASIILGEIFNDVKIEIGRKANSDGLYVKWLEDNGFNKMTALRHRNRYNLFKICKNECGKLTIATLPIKLIQEIVKTKGGERGDLLRKIDDGATREEIEDLIGIDLLEDKNEETEKDLVRKIDIYDFSDSEKLNNIKDSNELKFYRSKYKEFKEILDKGNDILINKEIELSNKKNEFKTVTTKV